MPVGTECQISVGVECQMSVLCTSQCQAWRKAAVALWWNRGLREVRGIPRLFEQLLAFQQWPYCMALVTLLVSQSVR
jgi:hypothetical protein